MEARETQGHFGLDARQAHESDIRRQERQLFEERRLSHARDTS